MIGWQSSTNPNATNDGNEEKDLIDLVDSELDAVKMPLVTINISLLKINIFNSLKDLMLMASEAATELIKKGVGGGGVG